MKTVGDAIRALSRLDPAMPIGVAVGGCWLPADGRAFQVVPGPPDCLDGMRLAVFEIGWTESERREVAFLGFAIGRPEHGLPRPTLKHVVPEDAPLTGSGGAGSDRDTPGPA